MIRSRLSGYGIHCDIVNPRRLELEAAKEILAELYSIQISEVDDLRRLHAIFTAILPYKTYLGRF